MEKMNTQKNAQTTFAFMISAVMFIGLVLYITNTISNIISPHFTSAIRQESEAYAYVISSMLMSSPGYWNGSTGNGKDWENHPQDAVSLGLASAETIQTAKTLGISSPYHRLSLSKINNMSAMANGQIRALLGENHIYSFCIGKVDTQDCGIMNRTGQVFTGAIVTRYAIVENGTQTIPARLIIEVL